MFNKSRFESLLKDFVEIPTVSMEPERKGDIRRLADKAMLLLKEAGFQTRLVETKGNPIVFGEYAPNKKWKTLALYNHLDVQPADPSEWNKPPFVFFAEEGKYYARGATDDKGPALTGLLAIQQAIQEKVPINFQIIYKKRRAHPCG